MVRMYKNVLPTFKILHFTTDENRIIIDWLFFVEFILGPTIDTRIFFCSGQLNMGLTLWKVITFLHFLISKLFDALNTSANNSGIIMRKTYFLPNHSVLDCSIRGAEKRLRSFSKKKCSNLR